MPVKGTQSHYGPPRLNMTEMELRVVPVLSLHFRGHPEQVRQNKLLELEIGPELVLHRVRIQNQSIGTKRNNLLIVFLNKSKTF